MTSTKSKTIKERVQELTREWPQAGTDAYKRRIKEQKAIVTELEPLIHEAARAGLLVTWTTKDNMMQAVEFHSANVNGLTIDIHTEKQ